VHLAEVFGITRTIMRLPPLRTRKAIYLCLAVPSTVYWFPFSALGLVLIIGIVGLVCLPLLLRCIVKLPITNDKHRKFYRAVISTGVVTLGLLLVFMWSGFPVPPVAMLVYGSGLALLAVGCAVLAELKNS
jgi:hypothetical protein